MADKPKKQSPLIERTGSLTGDRTLSDLIDQYNLRDYVAPAAATLVGVPVLGKFAKPVAKAVGKEAARRVDKYMGDTGLRMNVVKPEGGQWEKDAADKLQRNLVDRSGNKDIDRWLQTTARKYIMNRSGSPSDEIRLLADQGITHLSPSELRAGFEQGDRDIIKDVVRERVNAGYPNLGVSNTDLGSRWELRADAMIQPFKAEDFLYSSGMRREMPWLEKIDPKTPVYGHTLGDTPEHLGMDKLSDALRTEINAGRLRPEQLNKVSIGDAVKLAHQQRLAREAAAQETLQALPRVRDYPEGFTWQELTHEDPATLDMILKREGDIMQNCIGGYCSDVIEDGTRLFSLRDAAGNPHVNIEMKPESVVFSDMAEYLGPERAEELLNEYGAKEIINMYPELRQYRINQVKGKQNAAPIEDYMPYVQDFVTNPVHGNPYSEVRDLQNTGLIDLNRLREHGLFDLSSTGARGREINAELNRIYPAEVDQFGGRTLSGPYGVRIPSYDMMRGVVQEMPGNYASPSSLIEYLRGVEPRPIEHGYSKYWEGVEKPEGFAKGGAVDFDHPDPDEAYEFRDFGLRQTGEPKEEGALGLIRMPDGMTDMTEYSINVDGKEMPSIIEGMHPADINYIRETGDVPEDAVRTAIHSARKREAQGKNPFWNRKEDKGYAEGGLVYNDYDEMFEFR